MKDLVEEYGCVEEAAAAMGVSGQAVKTWTKGRTPSRMMRRVIEGAEKGPKGVVEVLRFSPMPAARPRVRRRVSRLGWSDRVRNLMDRLGSPEALAVRMRVTASAVRNWLGGKIVPSGPVQVLIEMMEGAD